MPDDADGVAVFLCIEHGPGRPAGGGGEKEHPAVRSAEASLVRPRSKAPRTLVVTSDQKDRSRTWVSRGSKGRLAAARTVSSL